MKTQTLVTIPRNIAKMGELVVLPRKEFEQILRLARKKYPQLDRDLDRNLDKAIEEVRQGKAIGPFNSVKSLRVSLEK